MTGRILLIIGGGIAAYKTLELIRRLADVGISARCVMTTSATEFITPLSVQAISGERVFTELFDIADEHDIGHIRLSREADLIAVVPATANLLAKMAHGLADDLASTVLLATDKPILAAPAMNPYMWRHPATARNVARLAADGVSFVAPEVGEMAEAGEAGIGRLASVPALVDAIESALHRQAGEAGTTMTAPPKVPSDGAAKSSVATLAPKSDPDVPIDLSAHRTARSLAGRHVLITAGPTHEPIDPVRYIANRSSGKQGFALAAAARAAGARVTLISGPVGLADPAGVDVWRVETAAEMLEAVTASLPADVGIFAAAVADWRMDEASSEKIKKKSGKKPRKLKLAENADILATVAGDEQLRPTIVVGFAAETTSVVKNARRKLKRKAADVIVANDVSPETGIMGGDRNTVHLISTEGVDSWPGMEKSEVAKLLIDRIARKLTDRKKTAS